MARVEMASTQNSVSQYTPSLKQKCLIELKNGMDSAGVCEDNGGQCDWHAWNQRRDG